MTSVPVNPAGTVFIVDDDASFLRSLSRLLSAVGYTVQTFESAQEFLNRLSPEMSGCVVADLQMPGLNGLELQKALKLSANPLPVIFLTGQGDIPTTVMAMRGGAVDYLVKRAPKEELLAAVQQAFEHGAKERRQREHLRGLRRRFDQLSQRELEVLERVVLGWMNKQIAADLNIIERTVKLHRTNLTRKLGVQSVAELTRLVDEAGLFKSQKENPTNPAEPGRQPSSPAVS
jgi:FixJ family two-component response regulator